MENIRVIHSGSSAIFCDQGYTRHNQDLNQDAGGDYIYLCVKYGAKAQALTFIDILNNADGIARTSATKNMNLRCPSGTQTPVDLNEKAGGDIIFFLLRQHHQGSQPVRLKDVGFNVSRVVPTNECQLGSDWTRASPASSSQSDSTDLNKNADGKYIYLCVRR